MSKVTDVDIKTLVSEIQAALGNSLELGEVADKLKDAENRLPSDVNGKTAGKWADLSEAEQNQFHEQLVGIRKELGELRGDAPTPCQRGWLLFYASVMPLLVGASIVACVLYGEALPTTPAQSDGKSDTNVSEVSEIKSGFEEEAGSESAGEGLPEAAGQTDKKVDTKPRTKLVPPPVVWVILVVILLGAFGGCLRLISSLVLYLGESGLRRTWLAYYYTMPLVGGMLAPIVCLLILGGILEAEAGSETSESQYLYFYALAAFSGLFASNVLRKLKDLADALFSKPSVTDAGR